MEKLIKLLNEYNIELHGVDRTYKDGFDLGYEQEYMRDFRVAYLISKSFGFVKRLVDNDKIDYSKLVEYEFDELERFIQRKYNALLMLLSIQNNPIDLLCELLK